MTFRHVATRKEWALIVRRKAGPCRGCGGQAESFHHLLPRSLGGSDVAENIVPLCGDGVRGCHGLIETHGNGWRLVAANIRCWLLDSESEYLLAEKGPDFLDRYYPEETGLASASIINPQGFTRVGDMLPAGSISNTGPTIVFKTGPAQSSVTGGVSADVPSGTGGASILPESAR